MHLVCSAIQSLWKKLKQPQHACTYQELKAASYKGLGKIIVFLKKKVAFCVP